MTSTAHWAGTATARSSLVHGGRMLGTTRLLRRETVVDAHGKHTQIPVVSGNAVRAMLRHRAEEMMGEVLDYAGQLTFAAAVTLRGGGRLVRSTREPLSGSRLLRLCGLVPVLSIFGGSSASGTIKGCLQVGKLTPHLLETAHLFPGTTSCQTPAIAATQQESYTRADHETSRDVAQAATDTSAGAELGSQMLFNVESFPAGTRFGTWFHLDRATDADYAFFADVLAELASPAGGASVGGRTAIGHGQLDLDLTHSILRGHPQPVDWRTKLTDNRTEILELLAALA